MKFITFLALLTSVSALPNVIPDTCIRTKIPFDPFQYKDVYTIGVHATRGLDSAESETTESLGMYLSETAGKAFDPPIEFKVKAFWFDDLFNAIEAEEVDFFYANPGVYSCIGTQVGATALTTVIKELDVRGQTFDLDVYGGVIATRADNDKINSIADLKDKVIGAGAIIDLMGGQMQIYEMGRAGLSYVNDPKQVVFTKDQIDVVTGVLSGRFDVGFIRTDQIELTRDANGELVDPTLFKIISPKIYVMDTGELFPFLHSTDIFPEWPVAAMGNIPLDIANEVQRALINFGAYVEIGRAYERCLETSAESFCNTKEAKDYVVNAPCDATQDLVELANLGSHHSHIVAHRPSRSYHGLRDMQEAAGFMVKDGRGDWYCTRPSNLYEGITCPEGFFKRSEDEFYGGCAQVGLNCAEKEAYDCFCKPCVEAFEVDIYEHNNTSEDLHLIEYYGDSLPGCEKMSICSTVYQGETTRLRIYDNMHRDSATVTIVAHAGDTRTNIPVKRIGDTYAYEFLLSSDVVQVNVIEVMFNGIPVSQSPIRVTIQATDCEAIYGENSGRLPDEDGECVCSSNTYELVGACVDSVYFFLIIFSIVIVAMGFLVFVYLGYKKQQHDSVWHVNPDELHFSEPPEIIGQGGFGVVVLGQYRGTKVAVKRVLPPVSLTKGKSGSMSQSVESIETPTPKETKKMPKSSGNPDSKEVKFDKGDVEAPAAVSQSGTRSNSQISSANKGWEDLLGHHHSDNVLKILESVTASNHGSGDLYSSHASSQYAITSFIPLWMRFDEHSRQKQEFINEMRLLSRLRHPCITTVMGAVISNKVDPMLVMEYMEYGSLFDLLHNETMHSGGEIILQIIRDIVQGVQFLHASKPPIFHGDLKAKNILVDSRFRAKVADFGFSSIKKKKNNIIQGTPFFMAPEYLRRKSEYNAQCDIYSFSMILYEIYARADPFEGEDPRKILPKICHPRINKRPDIPPSMPPKIAEITKKCWSANPFFRPTAKELDYLFVEMGSKDTDPLESNTNKFKEGMQRKATSLYDVFPKHIADALNAGKKVEAESHEAVTVIFSDIVDFEEIANSLPAMKVSNMLDRLYRTFDDLASKHEVFKVETVGDAYMGVSNVDGTQYDTHCKNAAEYAIEAVEAASKVLIDEGAPERGSVQIRVGFHSGPVVSNVIGSLNPTYGLFGDTVNTASRMESSSTPGKVLCSYASATLLESQAPELSVKLRGKVNLKGKGNMMCYWVDKNEPAKPVFDYVPSFSSSDDSTEEEPEPPTPPPKPKTKKGKKRSKSAEKKVID